MLLCRLVLSRFSSWFYRLLFLQSAIGEIVFILCLQCQGWLVVDQIYISLWATLVLILSLFDLAWFGRTEQVTIEDLFLSQSLLVELSRDIHDVLSWNGRMRNGAFSASNQVTLVQCLIACDDASVVVKNCRSCVLQMGWQSRLQLFYGLCRKLRDIEYFFISVKFWMLLLV